MMTLDQVNLNDTVRIINICDEARMKRRLLVWVLFLEKKSSVY